MGYVKFATAQGLRLHEASRLAVQYQNIRTWTRRVFFLSRGYFKNLFRRQTVSGALFTQTCWGNPPQRCYGVEDLQQRHKEQNFLKLKYIKILYYTIVLYCIALHYNNTIIILYTIKYVLYSVGLKVSLLFGSRAVHTTSVSITKLCGNVP